ncbi:uncharacterized protein LOC143960278 isoform X1 [Lithobates pipiens]
MAAIEHVLERLRAQAEVRGSEWLTEQVERWIGETEAGTSSGEPVLRARRSRPPACFSPGPAPRPPRDRRSPGADRSVPPAKRRQQDDRGLGRSARRRPTPGGGATGHDGAGSPPSSPATVRVGDPCGGPCTSRGTASGAEGSARRTESAYRGARAVGGGRRADAGLLDGQTGGLTPRGGAGGRPRSGSLRQSGSKAPVVKDLPSHLLAAASGSGSPRGLLAPAEREEEDRSEGELSAEDDVVPPAVESGNAAAGRVPGRPVGQVPGTGTWRGGSRDSVPGVDLGAALGVAAGWIRRSVSGATWTAYVKVWREWQELVREVDGTGGAGDGRLLALYFVVRNVESGRSAAVIDRKLAGLSFLFKLLGSEDWSKGFWIRQMLKGFRKQSKRGDTRRPVTFGVLVAICGTLVSVCTSPFEVRLFTAAFSLAFYGAFRIGELVSPSRKVPGGLGDHDVRVAGSVVEITLRRSKTDQRGRGVNICLFSLAGSQVCPVEAVRSYRAVRPGSPGPFLVHADGSFLSRFQFVAVFRRSLALNGWEESEYASHSFRIGAATEAARCGLDEAAVRRIGRWESRRFRSYVRPQLAVGRSREWDGP